MLAFLKRHNKTAQAGPNSVPFDRDAFARDGFVILKNVFNEADKAELRGIYARMQALVADGKITRTAVHTAGDHAELFDRIDLMEPMRQAARAIIGENYCRLTSRFLIKDPAYNGPIPAHQDYPYFPGHPDKLNLFVPLTRCHPGNGMLIFLKGSHKYGPLERGTIAIDRYPQLERVQMDIDVGDLVICHFLNWHFSEGATETSDRVMVQTIYQPSTDPSSKYLVSGVQLNDAQCSNRTEPLATRETDITLQNARVFFQHGALDACERTCLDMLSTDPENARVLILLRDVYAKRGDETQAAEYSRRAREEAAAALKAASE